MSTDIHDAASRFLVREAALLDSGDYEGWLALLDPGIEYLMPVRSVRYGNIESEFSRTAFHYNENLFSLRMRVARLRTRFAWAEDPPSRYRHFISNIEAEPGSNDLYTVTSNVMLYRGRGAVAGGELLTAARRDQVRQAGNGLRLARREVFLDQVVLPVSALTTFL
jgi:3-phenylpropionate/cinnamic acid dioxygenase small subunit